MSTAITKRRQAPRTRPVFFSRQPLTSSIADASSPSTRPFTPVPSSASTTRSAKSRSTRAASQCLRRRHHAQLAASLLPALQIRRRLAANRRRIGKEENAGRSARFAQTARHHHAVAAVISLAAENHDIARRQIGKVSLQIIRHARARVLHQLQAGNAVALGGQPVHLAHLFRGKHFHGSSIMARSLEKPQASVDPPAGPDLSLVVSYCQQTSIGGQDSRNSRSEAGPVGAPCVGFARGVFDVSFPDSRHSTGSIRTTPIFPVA